MKKKRKSVSSEFDNNIEEQALAQLNSQKYKEAIGLYKKLLQDSDNDEWHQQLAYCYVQRAATFAAKGMFKEALVLWDNHLLHAQPPYASYDQYISWLILSKNKDKILSHIEKLSAQQLDQEYPQLAALLGFLMLTEYPDFQQKLPEDSAFIKHFKLVQHAFLAYQNNDLKKLNEALQQLPYRSAFRDLRIVLSAVIALADSLEKGRVLLAKIPVNSPYQQVTQLLLAVTQNGSVLAQSLIQVNHGQRRLIGEIKGLNKKQLEFIEHFSRQHSHLSDKVKFNMAIQYKSLCGPEFAKQFCQVLLASYSAGHKDFKKSFGESDSFEDSRLKALLCERDNNTYDAEYYWRLCITELIHDEAAENDLKIALVLRHIAKFQSEAEDKNVLLIESLEYDSEDRDSYFQVLNYYSHHQKEAIKEYKQWLSKTIEKFPKDVDVLVKATQAATRNKAYKKASQYASAILTIDPLNTFAKQTLFSSHLAHAQRLMLGKKYSLVEKEIQQAEKLNIGKSYMLQTQLMRGMFCFVNEDKQQGLQLITEALNKINSDPVNTHFQATMEALLSGLPVATILRELPAAKDHLLTAPELTAFIHSLEHYTAEEGKQQQLHKALEKIKAPLKKSLSAQAYDETLLLSLCQLLDKLKHFELLRHCSKLAFFKWKKPIWMYYRVYADNNGNAEECSFMEVQRLESFHEQVMTDKDHRTGKLIGDFLEGYYQAHPSHGLGFLGSLFGFDEEDDSGDEDPLDALFGHLPDEILIKLESTIDTLAKKTNPEQLAMDVVKVTGGENINVLFAMMKDPDLFSALIMLKAADKLEIDIKVKVSDVLEYFDVGENTNRFPFPF